ncbi:MAG TPA: hypothetical protein VMV27_13350 [Candidatus Binataceae bacterium]|nr:hypothetical protein [Candidatus Binataceae bacterium]
MKKCSIAAVFALTWLMMMPPPKMPPVKGKDGNYEVNLTVPVARWIVFATYRNQTACRGDLKQKPSYFVCVEQRKFAAIPAPRMPAFARPPQAAATPARN